jgi:hypothetical protein
MKTVMAFVELTSTWREVMVNLMEGFSYRSMNEDGRTKYDVEIQLSSFDKLAQETVSARDHFCSGHRVYDGLPRMRHAVISVRATF